MASKKVLSIKVLMILMILISLRIIPELLAPQPVSLRRSTNATNSQLREDQGQLHQSQPQPEKVKPVFTLAPELPHNIDVLIITKHGPVRK